MACWYNGYYLKLSTLGNGFDSRTGRQFAGSEFKQFFLAPIYTLVHANGRQLRFERKKCRFESYPVFQII